MLTFNIRSLSDTNKRITFAYAKRGPDIFISNIYNAPCISPDKQKLTDLHMPN